MSVWEQKGRYAPRTRTVTGAILAPYETQRLVVSGKTGHQVLRRESETGFACLLTRAAKWRPLIGAPGTLSLPGFDRHLPQIVRFTQRWSSCPNVYVVVLPKNSGPVPRQWSSKKA